MYVDWMKIAFNHTLTSMKANGLAATKSGNAFEVTLDNSEYIEKPILSFTGEVRDQAQDVVWAAPTKDADFETRTATIRNWAENGVDYTDYTLTVKRPLDSVNVCSLFWRVVTRSRASIRRLRTIRSQSRRRNVTYRISSRYPLRPSRLLLLLITRPTPP